MIRHGWPRPVRFRAFLYKITRNMYYLNKKKKSDSKTRRKKSAIDTLEDKLDSVFSLYIRLRDSRDYDHLFFRCISCGMVKPFEKADCGHYFSRRNQSTRYNEVNCHAECSHCNRFKADHLHGYRENLIKKIGQERFDLLAWEAKQPKKWTEFELRALIDHYKREVKKLKQEKGL